MRVINFPLDKSVGEILVSENIRGSWDNAIEAKGKIKIPDGKYISFWLGTKISLSDLNFLSLIKPDDLDGFLAASRFFNDAKAEKILHLSHLDSLQLWETEITNKTLEKMDCFPKLSNLGLDTTRITDVGLKHLEGLQSLRELCLLNNEIKGDGLQYLTNLNLGNLDLMTTAIDDTSIKYLKQMKILKYLRIFETQISETGFNELKAYLPNCQIRFHYPF